MENTDHRAAAVATISGDPIAASVHAALYIGDQLARLVSLLDPANQAASIDQTLEDAAAKFGKLVTEGLLNGAPAAGA